MSHRRILASSAVALAGLALAGCGVFAPEDSANTASAPSESAPAAESDEHTTGLEHITEADDDPDLADGAVRPEDTAPGPQGGHEPPENSAPLPAPEDLNSELMVAPGADHQGSEGQPRGKHALPEHLWNGQVPLWVECTDEAALAANAGHEPAGWPAERQSGEPLPNPLCHPDFIEMLAWDHYDEFMACCEGLQNGTTMMPPGADDQRVFGALWEASQERADWSPGDTELDQTW